SRSCSTSKGAAEMAGKAKLRSSELYTAIQAHYGPGGALIEAGEKLRGDDPAVQLRPALFALASLGQRGIDEKTRTFLEDVSAAAENRNRMWYGPPQPEPESPRRAIAIKAFTHGDLSVKVGDIFPSDAPVVSQVSHGFVIAED